MLKFQDFQSIESLIIGARRKAGGEPIHQRYEMPQVIQGLISSHHFSHNREASGQTLKPFEHLQRFLCLINTNYMNLSIGIVNHTVLYILFFSLSLPWRNSIKRPRNLAGYQTETVSGPAFPSQRQCYLHVSPSCTGLTKYCSKMNSLHAGNALAIIPYSVGK